MASKTPTIYLGFLDEQLNSKNGKNLSYTTNKVGGQPNWCVSSCENPLCNGCKGKMSLVIQLYAPLENSPYHRTLYIFACVRPQCWNSSHGWACLRSQILDTKTTTISKNINIGTDDDFWMEEDDWNIAENDDGNGNPCPSTQILMNYKSTDNSSYCKTKNEIFAPRGNHNENQSFGQALHTVGEVTKCFENQMNINMEDSNANDEAGATAVQEGGCVGLEASALIEGPEGDMVAVETPEKPNTDLAALLKQTPQNLIGDKEICFVSYFISVELEPPENTQFTDHERELFFHYTQVTGHNIQEEDFMKSSSGQYSDDSYEKCSVSHGDSLLHKFKKRLMRSPQQIIRYCRDEVCDPLWMRPPVDIPKNKSCNSCGGPLVFEAQIMPQLIPFLKPQGAPQSSVLEFGTVVLYTCFSSCWKDGLSARPEVCVVQGEEP